MERKKAIHQPEGKSVEVTAERLAGGTFLLRKTVPALPFAGFAQGVYSWGPMVDLPVGAELETVGPGMDNRTLRVRYGGCVYLVFKPGLFWAAESPHAATLVSESF